MKMRNVTCVGTQTSKVRTRVTLLFINYSVNRSIESFGLKLKAKTITLVRMFPLKIIFLFMTVWFNVQLKNMETNEISKLQDEYKQSSLKNIRMCMLFDQIAFAQMM